MGLFSPLDVRIMETGALVQLEGICQAMMQEPAAERHHDDYAELYGRLVAERIARERAATTIQALVRGNAVRDDLKRKNNAAIVLQSAFRQYAAKKTVEELRKVQAETVRIHLQTQVAAQLASKIATADTKLAETTLDPRTIADDKKVHLAELIIAYEADAKAAKGKKASTLPAKKARASLQKVDDYVRGMIDLVEADLAAALAVANAARTVTLPADFHVQGAFVDRGSFLYPGAGYLRIGTVTYQLHPNRSLVHVKDELPAGATLAKAQAYLNSALAACRKVIADQRQAPLNVISAFIQVNDVTDNGRTFFWRVKYTRYDARTQAVGHSGSIEHIDSGYENSQWLR